MAKVGVFYPNNLQEEIKTKLKIDITIFWAYG